MQHPPVHDAPRERQHEFGVWNGPEVVGEVEAPAALAWYAEGKAFGKTVIRVAP
jgi:hypothetical protein